MKLLSVIIPVYNCERYILRCLNSIMNQSYKDIEVIVINDGSIDGTLKICLDEAKKDSRIKVISQSNAGVTSARMAGIESANGRWITFVDADDYLEVEAFAEYVKRLVSEETDIVVTSEYTVRGTLHNMTNSVVSSRYAIEKLCCFEFPTSMWAGMYSTSLVREVVFDTNLHFFEDYFFMYQILHKVEKVSIVHIHLYNYCINNGSINSQGISEKRMTCLRLINILSKDSRFYDKKIRHKIEYSFSHFLICNIVCLKNGIRNEEEELYEALRRACLKELPRTIVSQYVPATYKISILICSISPHLLSSLYKVFIARGKK